jgi:very-short-patch-repair endonuclease
MRFEAAQTGWLCLGSRRALARFVPKRNSRIYNDKDKKPIRQKLRWDGTSAEAVLWKSLQRRQILGRKFRRQQSIGRYIVDFYCPECRLIVELDGAPHFTWASNEYDAERTGYLESLGLKVIRFENWAVHRNLEFVLEEIRRYIQERTCAKRSVC